MTEWDANPENVSKFIPQHWTYWFLILYTGVKPIFPLHAAQCFQSHFFHLLSLLGFPTLLLSTILHGSAQLSHLGRGLDILAILKVLTLDDTLLRALISIHSTNCSWGLYHITDTALGNRDWVVNEAASGRAYISIRASNSRLLAHWQ